MQQSTAAFHSGMPPGRRCWGNHTHRAHKGLSTSLSSQGVQCFKLTTLIISKCSFSTVCLSYSQSTPEGEMKFPLASTHTHTQTQTHTHTHAEQQSKSPISCQFPLSANTFGVSLDSVVGDLFFKLASWVAGHNPRALSPNWQDKTPLISHIRRSISMLPRSIWHGLTQKGGNCQPCLDGRERGDWWWSSQPFFCLYSSRMEDGEVEEADPFQAEQPVVLGPFVHTPPPHSNRSSRTLLLWQAFQSRARLVVVGLWARWAEKVLRLTGWTHEPCMCVSQCFLKFVFRFQQKLSLLQV